MKRFITFIAGIACMALLLSGCSLVMLNNPDVSAPDLKQTDPSEQVSTQATQTAKATQATQSVETSPTAPPINDPYPQYVQTDINEMIISSDSYGKTKQIIPVGIPKLLPFSEDAITCQNEIQDRFGPTLEEMRQNASEGYSISHAYIEHFVYLNDTILSVVIHERSVFDSSAFTVYNFDIESGKQLNIQELMNKLQITDYAEKFTQTAKETFEANYGHFNHDDFYQTQLATTVNKENIDKVKPYVAENGKVMIIINIYALAGAAYYPEAVPLS